MAKRKLKHSGGQPEEVVFQLAIDGKRMRINKPLVLKAIKEVIDEERSSAYSRAIKDATAAVSSLDRGQPMERCGFFN